MNSVSIISCQDYKILDCEKKNQFLFQFCYNHLTMVYLAGEGFNPFSKHSSLLSSMLAFSNLSTTLLQVH